MTKWIHMRKILLFQISFFIVSCLYMFSIHKVKMAVDKQNGNGKQASQTAFAFSRCQYWLLMSQKREKISRNKLQWFAQTRIWKEIQTWGEVSKQQSGWCHVFNYKEKIGVLHENVIDRLRRIDKNVRKRVVKQMAMAVLNKHLHGHCSPCWWGSRGIFPHCRQSTSFVLLCTKYLLCSISYFFTLLHYNPMQTLFARYAVSTHLQ